MAVIEITEIKDCMYIGTFGIKPKIAIGIEKNALPNDITVGCKMYFIEHSRYDIYDKNNKMLHGLWHLPHGVIKKLTSET